MTFKLKQGNCLEVMKAIPDESIHHIITDVPYGISYSEWDILHANKNSALLGSSPAQAKSTLFKSRGKPKNGWSKEDRNISLDFQKFYEIFSAEAFRILKPAGYVIAFTGRQFQHRFMVAMEEKGIIIKDTLAWNKVVAPFRAQKIAKVLTKRGIIEDTNQRLGNLSPIFEPIVLAFKPYKQGTTLTDCYLTYGTGTFNSEIISSNLITYSSVIPNRLHETEKPLGLMEIIVNTFTLSGQTILDPFMGSGTTGVACVNTNRNFIGIEQDEKYFAIAKERIEKATSDA